tara:strand:+ start:23821 stop:24936 length:1116 start_codon:yes stop_codon:yes gene_type:complete
MTVASSVVHKRARSALQNLFIADALAMPVHWFYNVNDIQKAFPGGVDRFEAAPALHPSSIMPLHSTRHGGRGKQSADDKTQHIVGDVILKGKRQFWGLPGGHYHQGMTAGQNTLNAHCARLVIRCLNANAGKYDQDLFLQEYIAFMTADEPRHPDTYAESYHRGFFANYLQGMSPERCGAVTHDTPSIGALVTIAPIVIAGRLHGITLSDVITACRQHLLLTHPDEGLARICEHYVRLIDALLYRESGQSARDLIADAARSSVSLNLPALLNKGYDDREVIGRAYSSACYIDGAWPGVLYLLYKYIDDPLTALLANTNLGGDNVHRGAVLGVLLGLASPDNLTGWFRNLADCPDIDAEIQDLLSQGIHSDT